MEEILGMILDPAEIVRNQAIESISLIFPKHPNLIIDKLIEFLEDNNFDLSKRISMIQAIQKIVDNNKLNEEQYIKLTRTMFSILISELPQDITDFAIDILDRITIEMPEVVINHLSHNILNNQTINIPSLVLYDKLITSHHEKMLSTLNSDIKKLVSITKKLYNSALIHIFTVFYSIIEGNEIEKDQSTIASIFAFFVDTYLDPDSEIQNLKSVLDILPKYYHMSENNAKYFEYAIPKLIYLLEIKFDITISTVYQMIKNTNFQSLESSINRITTILINNLPPPSEKNSIVFSTLKILSDTSPSGVIDASCDVLKTNPTEALRVLLFATDGLAIPKEAGFRANSELWLLIQEHPHCLPQTIELWRRLAHSGIDVRRLGPALFQLAPRLPTNELSAFEAAAKEVAALNLVGDILPTAFDPLCLRVAHIALACARIAGQSVGAEYAVKAAIYAAAPFFGVQTRSDALFALRSESGFAEAADTIQTKQCHSCAHKAVLKLLTSMAEGSDIGVFLQTAQNTIVTIVNAAYPDTRQPVLAGNEAALFKSVNLTFAAAACAVERNRPLAKSKLTPLARDFDVKIIKTVQPFVLNLEFIAGYNSVLAADLYKSRLDMLRLVSDKDAGKRTLVLEHDVRIGTPGPHLLEILFASDIPKQTAAHAQLRILKSKEKVSLEKVPKHFQLIDRLLLSPDIDIIKPALKSLRMLLAPGFPTDVDLSTQLKKAFGALRGVSAEMVREDALAIVRAAPVSVNFPNICISIFNEDEDFSIFASRTLVELVQNASDADQRALNTASAAASVCLLLKDSRYFDDGVALSKLIFRTNRPPEEFALQHFLSSSKAQNEEFVPFLFSLMCLRAPWCFHAEKTISDLAKDERFKAILDIAFAHFGSAVSSSPSIVFKDLGVSLFDLDNDKFIGSLLDRPTNPAPAVVKLFAELIEHAGEKLLDVALVKPFEDRSRFHLGVVRVLRTAIIPEALQQKAFVYLVRVMCFVNALIPEAADALRKLSTSMKAIATSSVDAALAEAERSSSMSFVLARALFHPLRERLSMLDLRAFHGRPFAALAGYSEIVCQGRSLLYDILALGKEDANAALMALPAARALPAERYGEALIGQSLDFVISHMTTDEEAFRALLELFDYIPERVLLARAAAMFDSTIASLRVSEPPQQAFNCVSLFVDSKRFVNNPDLQRAAPHMAAIAFAFSSADSPQIIAVARTALYSLTEYLGMNRAALAVRDALSSMDFTADVAPAFVLDSERPFAEALAGCLSDPSPAANIAAATLCCALASAGRFLELRTHVRLLRLLASDSERVKIGVLSALSKFPPRI